MHDKLYNDSKVYSGKKHESTIRHFINESKDFTFSPKINRSRSHSRDNYIKTLENVSFTNLV